MVQSESFAPIVEVGVLILHGEGSGGGTPVRLPLPLRTQKLWKRMKM
jgi:hypothetical protein